MCATYMSYSRRTCAKHSLVAEICVTGARFVDAGASREEVRQGVIVMTAEFHLCALRFQQEGCCHHAAAACQKIGLKDT